MISAWSLIWIIPVAAGIGYFVFALMVIGSEREDIETERDKYKKQSEFWKSEAERMYQIERENMMEIESYEDHVKELNEMLDKALEDENEIC